MLILIAAMVILCPIIVILAVWSYTPQATIDYQGEFVNSAGDKFAAKTSRDHSLNSKSQLFLTDENGRSVSYSVKYTEPEQALPKDIYIIDIDEDSYITWVYDSDGGEMIDYEENGNKEKSRVHERFYLDSGRSNVTEYEINVINVIEQSKALDELPDAYIHKAKWESYFSRLKQAYENSNTSSKEDNV